MDVNGSLFDGINELAGHVSLVDHGMEFAAKYAIYAIVALVIASWFVRAGAGNEHRLAVGTAVCSAVVALVVALTIQHFYVHQRPFVLRHDVVLLMDHSADASFPSEHATVAFGLAAGVGLYRQRLGLLLLLLAVLVAFSRVYVGIHYPADVAGGAAIGILAAIGIWFARPALEWLDRTVVVRVVPEPLR